MERNMIYSGYWWEPHTPDDRWFGELHLSATRAVLHLYSDPFKPIPSKLIKDRVSLVLHSTALVSVMNCVISASWSPNLLAVHRTPFIFDVLGLVVDGYLITEELILNDVQLQFDKSSYLFEVGRFKQIPKLNPDGSYEFPLLSIPLKGVFNDLTLDIQYKVLTPSAESIGRREQSREPSFFISFEKELAINDVVKVITRFRRFLTLITGASLEITKCTSVIYSEPPTKPAIIEVHNMDFPPNRNWYSWQSSINVRFPITSILSEAPDVVRAWFEKYDDLEVVIDLLFTTLEYRLDAVSIYVLMCQALEALYSFSYKKRPRMDKDIYKVKSDKLWTFIQKEFDDGTKESDQFREIMQGALEHSNKPFLVDQILVLLGSIEGRQSNNKIIKDQSVNDLAKLIKETRNTLTHPNKQHKVQEARQKLPDLIPRVQTLLLTCLISQIGFTPEQIDSWFY
jgi:hypothetical protein